MKLNELDKIMRSDGGVGYLSFCVPFLIVYVPRDLASVGRDNRASERGFVVSAQVWRNLCWYSAEDQECC